LSEARNRSADRPSPNTKEGDRRIVEAARIAVLIAEISASTSMIDGLL
jgi:hypothetical protein